MMTSQKEKAICLARLAHHPLETITSAIPEDRLNTIFENVSKNDKLAKIADATCFGIVTAMLLMHAASALTGNDDINPSAKMYSDAGLAVITLLAAGQIAGANISSTRNINRLVEEHGKKKSPKL